ncbi:hypothetical protein FDG2_3292 [Candidatus Protofrankia californiensis]|uniref:Integrase catalytic domain-containing protein n=1 Tax=Candidatus Protofrankia californiensis TaxID=1839754 RepID=A0A1C3NZC5_9ACTN|nr:hypothetical protein FDG2_3292 [Candidatus Protofrankia californiensis]
MAFAQTVTKSFFATLECELLDRTHFAAHNQARAALFDFIEGFYNHRRRSFDHRIRQPSRARGRVQPVRWCRIAVKDPLCERNRDKIQTAAFAELALAI